MGEKHAKTWKRLLILAYALNLTGEEHLPGRTTILQLQEGWLYDAHGLGEIRFRCLLFIYFAFCKTKLLNNYSLLN